MTRRLSLAGQLLALQVVIICVVLVGVAAVTVAQSTQRRAGHRGPAGAGRRRDPGRTRSATPRTPWRRRGAVPAGPLAAETPRSNSGSASVVVADAGPHRPRQRRPRASSAAGSTSATAPCSRAGGRGRGSGRSTAAPPPWPWLRSYSDDGTRVARLRRRHRGSTRRSSTAWPRRRPNLLTYLGLASAIGIGGSLLVARRVKRQTLGLEPLEIAGLVEHRDAMLHGIREGVVGLDPRGRVTLVNDEAIRLLRIPGDALGRTLDELGVGEELRDALLSGDVERDRAVASAGRVLVVNRLPIASRGRHDRLGDDPARPHRAARAAPGARPHPARHRHAARPGARVRATGCTPSPGSSSSGSPTRRCASCTASAPAGRSSARR